MGKLSHARIDSRLDALLQRAQRLRSEYEDSAASSEPSTERAWRGPPASPTSVWPRSASLDEGVDRARGEAGTSDTDIQRLIARAADYKADRELQALDDEIPLSPLPRIRDRPSLRWGERAGVSAAEKAAAAAAQRAAAATAEQEQREAALQTAAAAAHAAQLAAQAAVSEAEAASAAAAARRSASMTGEKRRKPRRSADMVAEAAAAAGGGADGESDALEAGAAEALRHHVASADWVSAARVAVSLAVHQTLAQPPSPDSAAHAAAAIAAAVPSPTTAAAVLAPAWESTPAPMTPTPTSSRASPAVWPRPCRRSSVVQSDPSSVSTTPQSMRRARFAGEVARAGGSPAKPGASPPPKSPLRPPPPPSEPTPPQPVRPTAPVRNRPTTKPDSARNFMPLGAVLSATERAEDAAAAAEEAAAPAEQAAEAPETPATVTAAQPPAAEELPPVAEEPPPAAEEPPPPSIHPPPPPSVHPPQPGAWTAPSTRAAVEMTPQRIRALMRRAEVEAAEEAAASATGYDALVKRAVAASAAAEASAILASPPKTQKHRFIGASHGWIDEAERKKAAARRASEALDFGEALRGGGRRGSGALEKAAGVAAEAAARSAAREKEVEARQLRRELEKSTKEADALAEKIWQLQEEKLFAAKEAGSEPGSAVSSTMSARMRRMCEDIDSGRDLDTDIDGLLAVATERMNGTYVGGVLDVDRDSKEVES